MGRILLEVCCGSADDVIEAHRGGADRVELNCDLFHGGLTPTLGSLLVAKRETGMKIIAMVRPREGGFCYTQAEFAAAVEDGKLLLEHGADGLAFGFLREDGTVDAQRTRVLAELCREREREAIRGHKKAAALSAASVCAIVVWFLLFADSNIYHLGDRPSALTLCYLIIGFAGIYLTAVLIALGVLRREPPIIFAALSVSASVALAVCIAYRAAWLLPVSLAGMLLCAALSAWACLRQKKGRGG